MNVEARCGGGAININHLMAFQEVTDRTEYICNKVNVTKLKRTVIAGETPEKQFKINDKKEPKSIVKCAITIKNTQYVPANLEKCIWSG